MVTTENGTIKPIDKNPQLEAIKADDLCKMHIEKPFFVVENMFPAGLCVLAAPPKYGKSWLCLDLGVSVSTGTKFLGQITNRADVLYLALEDSYSRLQERLKKVLSGRNPPNGFSMATNAGTIQHGLIQQLEKHMENNKKTRLIIIDTFQKIRDAPTRTQTGYSADYADCAALKTFADRYRLCVVLVHHLRKMTDTTDTFANISGTAGISGAADTMITLSREKRTDADTKLSITGRDVEMSEFLMQFKKDVCRWWVLGTADYVQEQKKIEAYKSNPIVLTVKKLLEQNREGWTGSVSEIISASKYFKTPICSSAKQTSKDIGGLEILFREQDAILHDVASNGSGGKKHRFYHVFSDIR